MDDETLPSPDYSAAVAAISERCRVAHGQVMAAGPRDGQLKELWDTYTAEICREALREHHRLTERLTGALRDVADHHQPRPGWKLSIDCHGCDSCYDAPEWATWPCSTWDLIANGKSEEGVQGR